MLLDTNAIIFFVREPEKIKPAVMTRLKDPGEYRCLSLVTFWEIMIKYRKGKLPMPAPFASAPYETFSRWCDRAVIDILPIAPRHIERAAALAFAHDDAFDRLIAGTALSENQELVSSDKRFKDCPGLRFLAI
jgi:PIN domain nuclease of toxin-antitoxin system